jgi:hypothetical protein
MPYALRFQANVPPPLLFIQPTEKQIHQSVVFLVRVWFNRLAIFTLTDVDWLLTHDHNSLRCLVLEAILHQIPRTY